MNIWKCPRCGTTNQAIMKLCYVCKRPVNAGPDFDLPEHDAQKHKS
jgi:hypothetical protein